ncbi:MAG: diacylglycerol kinase family lipid kinase [Planctomycetaceae bacterium]|nr:diacylglycerol kinase family lipid kinase [Planctomycetaceae bacterium]
MPPVVSTAKCAPDANRVAILLNPKAGPRAGQSRADQLAELLRNQGLQAELFTDLAAAASQANRWHAEGRLRALVGVGGDGTAAELINRTAEGVPLTFLPAGNSNLLARYLGISKEPDALCRTIVDGTLARLDAAQANGRLFSLMVSCGFDADVVRRVHEHRHGHISHYSYGAPILRSIGNYRFPQLRIECDGANDAEPFLARWLFVFNLPCYGGGFHIAPQANGADGLLDVASFRRGGLWNGLWYAATILSRQHRRLGQCTEHRVRRLRITADAEVPYQLDGDPGGTLPLDIEVLPGRLTLLVPNAAPSSRPPNPDS